MTASQKKLPDMKRRNVEGILRIVKDGLCHRCGMCSGVCPAGTLGIDQKGYPIQVAECVKCNACVEVCSGVSFDYPKVGKEFFGESYRYGPALGDVLSACVGHSTDMEVRLKGASGGVVSQLLIHMLETGEIKGAVVAIQDPEDCARSIGVIARTREEVLAAAQSRYTVAPTMSAFGEIMKEEGPFAVVGLPCQIHSVHKAMMRSRKLADKIRVLIGLFCHFNLPREATAEPGRILGNGRTPVDVKYRQKDAKGWPYNTIEITYSDGTKYRAPYGPAEPVTFFGRVYPLGRCLYCLDVVAELADLAVGDPWIPDEKGGWKYEAPEGLSSVIVRTERGERILQQAMDAGKISAEPIPPEEVMLGQSSIVIEKKLRVPFRIMIRKYLGMPVPDYFMALPKPSLKIRVEEAVFLLSRVISKVGFLRRFLVRLAFSKFGQLVIFTRKAHKMNRASARMQKARRTISRLHLEACDDPTPRNGTTP